MAIKACSGFSTKRILKLAIEESTSEILSEFNAEEVKLLFVFAGTSYDQKMMMEGLRAIFPKAKLVGCSGEGVIFNGGSSESSFSLSITALNIDGAKITPFVYEGISEKSKECGQLINDILSNDKTSENKLLFLFPDGLKVNSTELFSSISKENQESTTIVGGAAGGRMNLENTYQYLDENTYSDSVVGVLVTGEFDHAYEVGHGCSPLGEEKFVTKREKTVVHKIDDTPIRSVVDKYFSNANVTSFNDYLTRFSFGEKVLNSKGDSEFLIHAPVAIDDEEGSIKFAVEINEGASLTMMRRDPKLIAQNSIDLIKNINKAKKKPSAIFQFDCCGRGRHLYGENLDEQTILPMQKEIDHAVPWNGFFTFGEIAQINRKAYYHSYSVVMLALYER